MLYGSLREPNQSLYYNPRGRLESGEEGTTSFQTVLATDDSCIRLFYFYLWVNGLLFRVLLECCLALQVMGMMLCPYTLKVLVILGAGDFQWENLTHWFIDYHCGLPPG